MVEYRIRMDEQNGVPDGTKWLLDGFPVMFLLNDFTDIGEIPVFSNTLPFPLEPGCEVLLQHGEGWFCDKVFDADKRLKELS